VALQSRINAILDQPAAEPDDVRVRLGAIHWGDLGCTGVEVRALLLIRDDQPQIVATIEKASPDATGLHDYVRVKLGRFDIVIETEW